MKTIENNVKEQLNLSLPSAIKVLLSYLLSMYIGVHGVWLTFSISYIIIIVSLKRKVKCCDLV